MSLLRCATKIHSLCGRAGASVGVWTPFMSDSKLGYQRIIVDCVWLHSRRSSSIIYGLPDPSQLQLCSSRQAWFTNKRYWKTWESKEKPSPVPQSRPVGGSGLNTSSSTKVNEGKENRRWHIWDTRCWKTPHLMTPNDAFTSLYPPTAHPSAHTGRWRLHPIIFWISALQTKAKAKDWTWNWGRKLTTGGSLPATC